MGTHFEKDQACPRQGLRGEGQGRHLPGGLLRGHGQSRGCVSASAGMTAGWGEVLSGRGLGRRGHGLMRCS